MRKKIICAAMLLLMTILLSSVHGSAKTYEENGFQYRVSKKSAVIT